VGSVAREISALLDRAAVATGSELEEVGQAAGVWRECDPVTGWQSDAELRERVIRELVSMPNPDSERTGIYAEFEQRLQNTLQPMAQELGRKIAAEEQLISAVRLWVRDRWGV
jgi:hypothetical protein